MELGFALQDLRVVSLARTRLGRVLRAEGDRDGARAALRAADRWFASSGGGEGAGLAACLRAAMDAEDGDPEAVTRLRAVLADAEHRHDPELQVLALDALARHAAREHEDQVALRLLERADRLMPSAQHLMGDADRLDAHLARQVLLLETSRQ
jgi:methylphosphotriester-DNA--protein-cysteine methyltransferase